MSADVFSGPLVTAGNMMDAVATSGQKTNPVAGPNITYQGQAFPDVRYYPLPKDALDNPGVIRSFYAAPDVIAVSAIPATAGTSGNTANVASPQPAISGVAMTLATGASVGVSLNIPYQNFATGAIATGALALDLGIETPSTTSASVTVTVANSTIYRVGQPIIITNVGNAAGTAHLFTYVVSLATATTITVADKALATNSTTARICSGLPGWANINGAGPIRPTFYAPYIAGGAALVFDETQTLERGVSIVGTALSAGGAFTIKGADIYCQTQSEVVTIASCATTGKSVKTYKMINSVTPGFADSTHTYSIVTQDLFGFPFRNDFWENLMIYFGQTLITSATGWTKADQTTPATTSKGDPRGTYALQTASQGANRLVIYQTLPFLNIARATPDSPQFLCGVTPV